MLRGYLTRFNGEPSIKDLDDDLFDKLNKYI